MKKAFFFSLLTLSVYAPLHHACAAGFYIQEQSISGLGAAFAGQAAAPRDASIVYFNPAGMTALSSPQVSTGAHLLLLDADITNTGSTIDLNPGVGISRVDISGGNGGNPYSPETIPNLHIAYPLLEQKLWIGFSSAAPFGLANEYDEGWFGRFDSTKTQLTTIDLSPSLAYALTDWLSIGGGLNVQYASANLESALRVTSEGTSSLNGEDWSAGYNIGLFITPQENTTLGLHYRSSVKHTLDGRLTIAGTGGGDTNIPAEVDLDLPDIAQIGINHKLNDKLHLLAGATWFGWNNFDTIKVVGNAENVISDTRQNYKNTWAFAVGGEYTLSDQWTLRAGYQFDATPTVDDYRTTRTPDGDRNWFSTGATYNLNEKFSLDFAAAYITVSKEDINLTRNISSATAEINATTEGQVGILSLGMNYKF